MTGVNVDPFFHQHLSRDVVPKLHENYGVYTVLPDDNDADAPVLLVFEGPAGTQPDYQVPRSQPSPEEVQAFQKSLEEAKNFLLEIINGQEAIKAQSIDVPLNFHEKLRRFIKREQESRTEKQIPVRVTASGTVVTLRGTASAVDALAEKVNAFIAQEIEDEKERGFKLSFDFPQKHANQLIGKQGSNIKELRDRFDVEIQVDDGKVTLTGPKAKAEAAKSHIEKLGKQWADETTHNLKVEPKYHRELIGASGNQINKLQTRYKVQIHFPRSAAKQAVDDQSVDGTASEAAGPKGGRRAQQPEDIVIVRGPSRGADEARDEILSLLQYLKDTSFSATVAVQQSQIPSLIGQGGKALDELREQTGARIDIPGSREAKSDNGLVEIQIKGTKAQVAAAKKAIEERKSVFEDTVVKTIEIEKKHHRALIGQGGSTLRDIILKAGGSDDRRELARTVQFPKTEEDGNKIKIEGRSSVVDGIIKAMEDIVSQRDAQTTEVVEVPASQHRNLIGRGGDTKNALQRKFKVAIDVPHKDSGKTGIKIVGLPADVEAAKEHILELTKEEPGVEILVPRHLHNLTSNNGQIFRQLRNDHGVTVDHKGHKIPAKSSVPKNARSNGALPLITDDATDDELHSFQTVTLTPGENDEAIPWVLRGSDAEKLKKAQATVENALSQAQKTDTIGYLVLPDPRLYRYVIGQGGAKLNGIRKQTGCKIDVPRQGESRDAIEIYGSSEGVDRARDLILEAVQEGAEKNQNHRRS
jgi:polyribonucleotide nucleotidyltransferase